MFEIKQKEGGVLSNILPESTQITLDKGTDSTPWNLAVPGKGTQDTALKVFSTTLLCHVCIYLILGRSRTSANKVHFI